VRRAELVGLTLGLASAIVFLLGACIWLLSAEATSVRALVAVWLWLLPALGLGAGLGWLAGRGIALLTRRPS
jgi:hypothetical protein